MVNSPDKAQDFLLNNGTDKSDSWWSILFAAFSGCFVAVLLIKFGNPVILEQKLQLPTNWDELKFNSWPIGWAYWGFIPLIILALKVGRKKALAPRWAIILPLIWLGWQVLSATQTVSPTLTLFTLKHFFACVLCFFLGWYALSEIKTPWPFWIGILIGFLWLLRVGFYQYLGGLEETRRHFYFYVLPQLEHPSTELLKKINSDRIFSTLFYPNSLAAALLLLLPICSVVLWNLTARMTFISRGVIVGLVGSAAMACLAWSGSKSGWLLMIGLILVALLNTSIRKKYRLILIGFFLAVGLVGFSLKYANYFRRGATSVEARKDYWAAAIQIFCQHPILGTGPGTYSIPYQQIKSDKSEMARLCHNDYLEQASDSGLVGFLAYFGMISGWIWWLYRNSLHKAILDRAVLLGLTGISLQSLVEFNLYIPALAWPVFLLFGFLLGRAKNPNGQAQSV